MNTREGVFRADRFSVAISQLSAALARHPSLKEEIGKISGRDPQKYGDGVPTAEALSSRIQNKVMYLLAQSQDEHA